jgi:DNA polymerase I
MDLLSSLMQQLFQRLHQEKLWDTFYRTEMRLLPLLASMELTGLTVDMGALRTIGRILAAEAANIEKEAHAVAGKDFNLASSKQVPVSV